MEWIEAIPVVLFGPPVALWLVAWRRLPRRAFVALNAGLVLALAGGELALRAADLGVPGRAEWVEPHATTDGSTPAYEPDGELLYRYPSNPRGYFDAAGEAHGTINALGYRGALRARERTPGVFRIAVLGDSFTLGIGVRDEDTLPARLERELGPGFEVLNFGVSSYDTVQEVGYLEGYVSGFAPDLALIVFFLNDTDRAPTIAFLTRPRSMLWLRARSYLLNATLSGLEQALAREEMRRHYLEGFEDTNPGWLRAREALRSARDECARRGVRLAVAVHPILFRLERYPFAPIHEVVLGFCAEAGIPAVDLLPAFAGRRDRELWVHANDTHPNQVAHRLSAALLADFLRREGLLEP